MLSFGFADGLSQPQIIGLDPEPKDKEPKAVKSGFVSSVFCSVKCIMDGLIAVYIPE